ncbi:MAG: hypothetical protein JRM99_00660 [Nitrososphaerota archaeon]|nr:hypothetical protein [Nitrososphaerota archaeon]
MKRRVAVLAIAIVAIAAFIFFAPIIRGLPTPVMQQCFGGGVRSIPPIYFEEYNSIAYYYTGYGGVFYPVTNSYSIFLYNNIC